MSEDTIKEMIKSERVFLHDLAGPISVCTLVVDLLSETGDNPQVAMMKKSLAKLQVMIKERRDFLIQRNGA